MHSLEASFPRPLENCFASYRHSDFSSVKPLLRGGGQHRRKEKREKSSPPSPHRTIMHHMISDLICSVRLPKPRTANRIFSRRHDASTCPHVTLPLSNSRNLIFNSRSNLSFVRCRDGRVDNAQALRRCYV